MSAHEDLRRRVEIRPASDRFFGVVLAAFFAALALWPLVRGRPVRWIALWVAAAFLLPALARPSLLAPANRVWAQLGLLLNRVVSPVVTALMFFLVMTPAGYLYRLFGKDPLRLRFDPTLQSYWMERRPAGPAPESMRNQF